MAYLLALLHLLWRWFYILLLCYVFLLALLYFLFLQLSHLPGILEEWGGRALQQPLRIERISSGWTGWQPALYLSEVRLLDPNTRESLAHFQQVSAQLDLVASLLHWQLITQSLSALDGELHLSHDPDGKVRLGAPQQSGASAVAAEATASGEGGTALLWILQQNDMALRDTRLYWQEPEAETLRLDIQQLRMHREGGTHSLEGKLGLSANERKLFPLGGGVQIGGGALQFNSSSTWQQTHLRRVEGRLSLQHLHLATRNHGLKLPQVSARFNLGQSGAGRWQLELKNLQFATLRERWPQSHIRIHVTPIRNGTRIEGQLGFVRLGELLPLLRDVAELPPQTAEALKAMQPSADLLQTRFSFEPDRWWLRSHFSRWQQQPWKHLPGLHNWSGILEIAPGLGRLRLDNRRNRLELPKLYSRAFELESLQGNLQWRHKDGKWSLKLDGLEARQASLGSLRLDGRLQQDNARAIQADLNIRLQELPTHEVQNYLPDRLLNRKGRENGALRWLRQGLPEGRVRNAEVLLQGALTKQLFNGQQGVFRGEAQVEQARVQYHAEWPDIRTPQATVRIDGAHLSIETRQGRIAAAQIRRAKVEIPNLLSSQPEVQVLGEVNGDMRNGLDFLANSPLRELLVIGEDGLQAEGPMTLGLDLVIPLKAGQAQHLQINGELQLKGVELLDAQVKFPVQKLHGLVRFNEQTLTAEKLRGELLGQPLSLSLRSDKQGKNITLQGRADSEFIQQILSGYGSPASVHRPLLKPLQGATEWRAELQLGPPPQAELRLKLSSDLRGLRSPLPAPLGKPAAQPRALRLELQRNAVRDLQLRLNYADLLNILLEKTDRQAMRGMVRFGKQAAQLPTRQNGFAFSGTVPYLSLSDWLPLLQSVGWAEPRSPTSAEAPSPASGLTSLQLNVRQLELAGLRLPETRVHLRRETRQWQVELDGKAIRGALHFNPDSKIITADLAHWFLYPRSGGTGKNSTSQTPNLHPRNMPGLDLQCAALYWDDALLGEIKLRARPGQAGWSVENWSLSKGDTRLSGNLLWTPETLLTAPYPQLTRFSARLSSPDFGATLHDFGYQQADRVRGGNTEILLNVTWPGNPAQLALKQLRGQLNLQVNQGQFTDLDPGAAGRMFGLFDLSSIPQRLSLDFRDVLADGFGFQRIEGEFFLEGGYAYTDGLHINSPAADILISGRTGLVQHSYEQQMIVTPHASNALPVAGAVLGGPAVGALTLFLQKILQKPLDSALSYRYVISGDWESPQIRILETPHTDNAPHAPLMD